MALTVFVLAMAGAAGIYHAMYGAVHLPHDRLTPTPAGAVSRGAATRVSNRLAAMAGADRLIGEMTRQSHRAAGLKPAQRRLAATLGQAGYYGVRAAVMFHLIQLAALAAMALVGAIVGAFCGRFALPVLGFGLVGYVAPRYILGKMGRRPART
ncbi:MAG: hypothetical protein ACREQD_00250 [Candidatus Binataceae bacterium]